MNFSTFPQFNSSTFFNFILEIGMNLKIITHERIVFEGEVDVTRANDAKRRAETRLADNDAKIDAERAQAALARSLARLKAALNK